MTFIPQHQRHFQVLVVNLQREKRHYHFSEQELATAIKNTSN
jgi:hypothetical protein